MGDGSKQIVKQKGAAPIVVQKRKQEQRSVTGGPQQINAGQQIQKPLFSNAITQIDINKLMLPDLATMKNAIQEAKLDVSEAQFKKDRVLEQNKERFELQKGFFRKVKKLSDKGWKVRNAKKIEIDKAMQLSDAELIKNTGKYNGPKEYLGARYGLISNKYYAMLPENVMRKLSRVQMLYKLKELYAAQNRNKDLIDYYENLIRITDAENAEKEKGNALPGLKEKSAKEKTEEKKDNKEALNKNSKILDSLHYDSEMLNKKKEAMRKIMAPKRGRNY